MYIMAKGLVCQVKNPCKSPTGGKKNQAKNKKTGIAEIIC
jgi:hypothetical protein